MYNTGHIRVLLSPSPLICYLALYNSDGFETTIHVQFTKWMLNALHVWVYDNTLPGRNYFKPQGFVVDEY
jgi:hypothetical protein